MGGLPPSHFPMWWLLFRACLEEEFPQTKQVPIPLGGTIAPACFTCQDRKAHGQGTDVATCPTVDQTRPVPGPQGQEG